MKRALKLLAIAFAAVMAAGLTACKEHVHDYVWTVDPEPWCTTEGVRHGVCECGETTEEIIPALGHHFGPDNKCTRCGTGIDPTEGLDYIAVEGGYAVAIGKAATAKEIIVPAYHDEQPVIAVHSEGFRGTQGVDAQGKPTLIPATFTSVWLPDGILTIGDRAFYGLPNLEKITLPSTLKEIGSGAFGECAVLRTVTGMRDLEVIGSGAFSDCVALKEAVSSDALREVGDFAFSGCTALLTAYYTGGKLEEVGGGVFSGCVALREAILKGDFALNTSVFENCRSLRSIEFNTLKSISSSALVNCDVLETIKYGGTTDEWNAIEKALDWCPSVENPEQDFHIECSNGTLSKHGYPVDD